MCILCSVAGLRSGHHNLHAAEISSGVQTASAPFSSGASYIDALTDNLSWTGTTGQSTTVRYNFDYSVEGGTLFTSSQRTAAQNAMQAWSDVANISFSQTSGASNTAPLTYSVTTFQNYDGLTTYFYSGSQLSTAEVQMDSTLSNLASGSYGFFVMLHEIGHAIGLKHPGNYSGSDTGPFLSSSEDTTNATVMSYNDGSYVTYDRPSVTPMIYDIAAAQYLYGANTGYHAGNDDYVLGGSTTAATIWDGGGTDTMNASGSASSVAIDLREGLGNVTTVGSNVYWIAFNANIENALGGSSHDAINGNALGNQIYGYGGNDNIVANEGNDTVFGGTGIADPSDGNDTIYGGAGSDALYGNSGNDTVYGGTGVADSTDSNDTIYGGKGADEIYGNSGNDYIAGGGSSVDPLDQADLIYGGKGADEIYGNGSNDTIYGGGASVDPLDEADTIYGGAGDDLIFGNGGNDTIYGNEGNDTFYGGAGDDMYYFGSGSGVDSVMQFDTPGAAGGDYIAVASGVNGFTTAAALFAAVSFSNGNAVIDLGSGNSITIAGINSGGLAVDDFLIV